MSNQVLMAVRFKDVQDLAGLDFSDIRNEDFVKGHKFFDVDANENAPNVLLSACHDASEGATYVVTSVGIYDSVFGKASHRNSIFSIDSLVKEVKSESKKMFKDKAYSIRKLRTKGTIVEDNGWKVACFNLNKKEFDNYASRGDFFAVIADFLDGKLGDFLGEIEGGLKAEPIRFGSSRRGLEEVVLDGNQVGIVRLNSNTVYTCDHVSDLKSEPKVLERKEGDEKIRKSDYTDDIGMKLFLEANGYEMTVARKAKK